MRIFAKRHVLVGGLGLIAACAGGAASGSIAKVDQTISVAVHAPATVTYGNAFSVVASSSSGLAVAFGSSGACTSSGATFTMTSGSGSCLVKYDQAGDGTYNAAPQVTESVVARKADQTLTFDPLEDSIYGDPDFDVVALATSELPVVFTASGNCTVAGGSASITGAGSCTVTASQPGDSNYNAASPVVQTFAIAKADQEITFDPLEAKGFGDADFPVGAEADSGLPVSFTARGQCTVRRATVHLTGVGSCKVTASQPGDSNYDAAPSVVQAFSIAYGAHSVSASLTAKQVVPKPAAKAPRAKAFFSAVLAETAKSALLRWKLTFSHLTGRPTAAYIRFGRPGAVGNLLVTLCARTCRSGTTGTAKVSSKVAGLIRAGKTYVDVRTARNPAGEIRGQIEVNA